MVSRLSSSSSSNLIGMIYSFGSFQFKIGLRACSCFSRSRLFWLRQRRIRVKVPRLGEELVLGQMLFIHRQRTDDPGGHVRVMGFYPGDELFHFAACAGTGAKDEDLSSRLQGFGHGFEEAVRVRFLLASRDL